MEKLEVKQGVQQAIIAYLIWGLFPLYWKLLNHVSADEILANRVFWSFIFMMIMLTCLRKWDTFFVTIQNLRKNKKQGIALVIASILVSCNWFIYIWAVNADRIIETSLGYYINPLVSVLLGMLVLKEKLSKIQYASFFLAAIGVFILTFSHGKFPWIAISLALTFGLYGLVKKVIKIDSEIGLTLETMVMVPISLFYMLNLFIKGSNELFSGSIKTDILLVMAGIMTAIPLLFFGKSAKKIPLSMLGFIQYMTPTLTLILGVFVYHEQFSKLHLLSFIFIWSALTIYSLSKSKLYISFGNKLKKNKGIEI